MFVLKRIMCMKILNKKTDRKIEISIDTSHNKFLELSAVSSADCLITGNTLDFLITQFEYTRILTPREYRDELHKFL